MKSIPLSPKATSLWLPLLLLMLLRFPAICRADDRLVGIWTLDEGFQVTELLFRSDGRYLIHSRSTDPNLEFSSTERGRYGVSGTALSLRSDEYFGDPSERHYEMEFSGSTLSLTRTEFSLTEIYQFKAGSRDTVLTAETAVEDPVGRWRRENASGGTDEFLFRPGGYYRFVRTHPESPFPPEVVRGRYLLVGNRMTLQPYSGVEAPFTLDYFGETLTLIREEALSGDSTGYERIGGSPAEVRAKSAEADAFLARAGWMVGTWEIQDPFLTVDVTFRPDGLYSAVNSTEFLNGTVRGRFALEQRRITLDPFPGQDPYARSNGEFGKAGQVREIDYYDGELQFINLAALSQSVYLATQRVGSEAAVREKTLQAQAVRNTEGWHLGRWEVRDPLGWMEFTLRPDGRYIVQSGANGIPSQVERGRYALTSTKLTLAPYDGLGNARGFEVDLFDGDLFVVGDFARMVIARKIPGSDAEVIAKTANPTALQGERGNLLGRWTSFLPGWSTELVLRTDGQFRLEQCSQTKSRDYGLFQVDLASRTLVLDSRFSPLRTAGLDVYDDTLTIYGGLGPTATYAVHLGEADEAIAASFEADSMREQEDAVWLGRVPVAVRDPNAVYVPTGDLPADPFPQRLFEDPSVVTQYRLYRRLIPGFVYFNVQGVIKSVAVVNTREWHLFPTGRVLVRFKNYHAGLVYPMTTVETTESWGAYAIGSKPTATDILHLFADNSVTLAMDSGDTAEMTLEDGRRHLFWDKDYLVLSEWAAEQKPIPCESSEPVDLRLMNTGLPLSSAIPPDPVGNPQPVLEGITQTTAGELVLRGTMEVAGAVAVDFATGLSDAHAWQPLQTNAVPAGNFSLPVALPSGGQAFFRVRKP